MKLSTTFFCANCGLQCRLVAALVALAVWSVVGAAPVPLLITEQPMDFANSRTPTDFGAEDALLFLHRYGYLNDSNFNASYTSEESFKDALTAYQGFSGLPITGTLDAATKKMMQIPRCGVKDIDPQGHEGGRQKRYAFLGYKFLDNHVTYRLHNAPPFSSPVSKLDVLQALDRAAATWATHTPLTFARAKKGRPADIDVSFQRGAHGGDGEGFDGRGGTLAHVTNPVFGGSTLHFDADELWTLGRWGVNIFQVAVHELGHSLGLDHSDVPDAVMAPSYKYRPFFHLHSDDINGIQALYGCEDEPLSFLEWLENMVYDCLID